jgi:putative membrane protein
MQKNLPAVNKLAEERTHLANERTMLAYIRTAIAFIASGLILIKFFENGLTTNIAFLSMLIGILLLVIGIALFYIRKKRVKSISES